MWQYVCISDQSMDMNRFQWAQCRTQSSALAGQLRRAHRGQEKQMRRRKISCDLAGFIRFFSLLSQLSHCSFDISHCWTRSTLNNNPTFFLQAKLVRMMSWVRRVRLDQIPRSLLEQKLQAIIKAQKKGRALGNCGFSNAGWDYPTSTLETAWNEAIF